MIGDGEWFVIKSGPHEGLIHMGGWTYSAHLGTPSGPRDDGWLGYASCPRCSAMVLSNDSSNDVISREILLHSNWHSNTDHPIPPEVTAEQDRIYQALSRGDR